MAKIDDLLKELCPDGVEWKTLSELGKFFGGLTGKSKSDFQDGNSKYITYKNVYENPSIDLAINDLVFVSDGEKQNIVQFKDVLFTGSSETPNECGMSSVITETPKESYYLNSFCFGFRLNDTYLFNEQFLKHYFRSSAFRSDIGKTANGVTRFNISKVKFGQLQIPILPLPIQQHIVEVLDTFTDAISNLEEELALREKQFEYYCNTLISQADGDVKTLGEIGRMERGNGLLKSDFTEEGFPCIHYGQIHTFYGTATYNTKSFCSEGLAKKLRKAKYGDLLIATTSEDVEACCKATVWLGEGEVAFSGDSYKFSHSQDPKYISYLFKTEEFERQKRPCATGAKVVRVSGSSMEKFKFNFPSLERQQEIVDILDTFEAMIANIKEEIVLRTKQYEYYREKLLSFGK